MSAVKTNNVFFEKPISSTAFIISPTAQSVSIQKSAWGLMPLLSLNFACGTMGEWGEFSGMYKKKGFPFFCFLIQATDFSAKVRNTLSCLKDFETQPSFARTKPSALMSLESFAKTRSSASIMRFSIYAWGGIFNEAEMP